MKFVKRYTILYVIVIILFTAATTALLLKGWQIETAPEPLRSPANIIEV